MLSNDWTKHMQNVIVVRIEKVQILDISNVVADRGSTFNPVNINMKGHLIFS